jgi:hypothetical protein
MPDKGLSTKQEATQDNLSNRTGNGSKLKEITGESLGPAPLDFPHFPTRQQAFIWRNWYMAPVENLAKVLGTDTETVCALAANLGLEPFPHADEYWLERGYITIIKANWHLLSLEQIINLLGWTEDRMAYALKEDDFLWEKLGSLKPNTPELCYKPLSPEEQRDTDIFRAAVKNLTQATSRVSAEAPFAFLRAAENPAVTVSCAHGKNHPVYNFKIRAEGISAHASLWAERFVERYNARWGCGNIDTKLLLKIRDTGQPRESHSVNVQNGCVEVEAEDELGILRALQWMESRMENCKEPNLPYGRTDRITQYDLRIIYPCTTVYGDPFLKDISSIIPDGMLEEYSKLGINGLWFHFTLYTLMPWIAAPELPADYQTRLDNLREMVERAKGFGIGVYLYLNEPRSLPLSCFEHAPEWKGEISSDGLHAAMCTSNPDVLEHLKRQIASLFQAVPMLAGVFTITASENLTNCWSRVGCGVPSCPRCAERTQSEVVAEVNAVIVEGMHSVNPEAKAIAWTWGWRQDCLNSAIDLLPDGMDVMVASEDCMPYNIGGVEGRIHEYCMSRPGPGEKALGIWNRARSRGLGAVAKVQVNTTWECAAVPYLPILDSVSNHLINLSGAGIRNLILSWTVGSQPSINLDMAARYYWTTNGEVPSVRSYLQEKVGEEAASRVMQAVQTLSAALRELPFDVAVLYYAPHNYGPGNLLYPSPTGYKSTLVSFPYDDLESWRSVYPTDVFQEQFRKLSDGWHTGLVMLESCSPKDQRTPMLEELVLITEAAWLHFRSAYLQILYVRLRDAINADGRVTQSSLADMNAILDEEIEIALRLRELMAADSRIGFESSCHYYNTSQSLLEKVMNCRWLKAHFANMQASNVAAACILQEQ